MYEDKCCIKRCRDISCINVIGHNLCESHWSEYCDWSDKTKEKIDNYIKYKNGGKK